MPSIKNTAQTVADIIRIHRDEITKATNLRDPNLTAEANSAKCEAAIANARTEALAEIGRHRQAAENELARIKTASDHARPTIPRDAAELIAAQQTWQFDILPVLESGTPLKTYLRSATLAQTLAAERFAGGYLTAKQATNPDPTELDGPTDLEGAVIGRLAVLDPANAATIEDGYRAAVAGESFSQVADLAEAEIRGEHIGFGGDRWSRAATIAANLPEDGPSEAA